MRPSYRIHYLLGSLAWLLLGCHKTDPPELRLFTWEPAPGTYVQITQPEPRHVKLEYEYTDDKKSLTNAVAKMEQDIEAMRNRLKEIK